MKDDILKLIREVDKIGPGGKSHNILLTFNSGLELSRLGTLQSLLATDEDPVRAEQIPVKDFSLTTTGKTEIAFSSEELKKLSFYFVKDMDTYCDNLANNLLPNGWLDKRVSDRIVVFTDWNQSGKVVSCDCVVCQDEICRIENIFKCFNHVKILADASNDHTLYFFIDKVLEFKGYKFTYDYCKVTFTTDADVFIKYFDTTGEHFEEKKACFKQQLEDTLRGFAAVDRPSFLMARFDEIFKNTGYAYQRYVRRQSIDKLDALLREKATEFLSQTQSILSSMTAEIGVVAGNILGLASLDYSHLNSVKNWMLFVCVFLVNMIFVLFSQTRLSDLKSLKTDLEKQEAVLLDDADDKGKGKINDRFVEFYERIRLIRRNWIASCWLVWIPLALIASVCIVQIIKRWTESDFRMFWFL
jgi:hypothetical protein